MKIAIIGGGISGLTTAFYIKWQNPSLHVDVYEEGSFLGGKMRTEEVDGFYFENGTNGFLSNKPDTLDLVKDCKAQHLLLKSNDLARIRFIYKDTLHQLPESPKAFLKTKLLSFKGKVRVLLEPFVRAKKDDSDETLQDFGYRRVGREMTDVFLDAMVAGIYGSTPSKISVNAAFPLVVNLEREYGGLFTGMIKKRKKSAGPGGILMSFKKGVSSFIDHLASNCGANIFLSSPVENIQKDGLKYTLTCKNEKKVYDKVILSTPSFVSAKLVSSFDEKLAKKLDAIAYTPISVVGFGFDELDHDLKGFGLLTTSSAKLGILGILWDSSIFEDRAKQGKKSLRIMIGGQRNKDLALKSDDELIQIAKQGIKDTMNINANPSAVFVKRYEKGIPSYELGHQKRVKEIFEELKKHEGLHLNSNAYNGVALNDCVKNSRQCAFEVLDF
ncbi:MAG: protoporphyrinogen oxidase [Proteobacteria bacterium]|nr:MAG: protoporphyrinogen oxidase [Pseudomonadota bacterium]